MIFPGILVVKTRGIVHDFSWYRGIVFFFPWGERQKMTNENSGRKSPNDECPKNARHAHWLQ